MSRPDGWDWNISDYTDSHTGQTLYRVSVHDCRQPAACNLSGYATSDAAEAAARKWISDKLGQDRPPTPVLPKKMEQQRKQADEFVSVIEHIKAAMKALPDPPGDLAFYSYDQFMRATDVYFWRWQRLLDVMQSLQYEIEMVREKDVR